MQSPADNRTGGVAVGARARLFVVSDDQKGRSYPVGAGRLTIGRGMNNDIVTADPRASRLHAEIHASGPDGGFTLVDPGSTNGTLVNGQRVSRVALHDGDHIQIGEFHLVFQLDTGQQPSAPLSDTGSHRLLPAQPAAPRAATPPGGTVAAASALPDVFPLAGKPAVTIGRDATNDIVLDHPQISRHHARLQLLPDGRLAVADLNSTNGTFIDGQQLRGATTVAAGVTLTFGPFRLLFQNGALIKGSEDGTIRIDCLGLSKQVAGGKVLLHDVTFSILPREFVCIVGGSGTGKSTLLDAISGVRPATGGQVRYNGADYYRQMDSFRSSIGYVPQDDIVPTELTVERALYYAAKLRLPDDMGNDEVKRRIEEVLDDLGLTGRRDVPIKNLSGGQRKRVSIGAELLSQPTLFFLDEPTSGLDPGLEGRMMALLRKLADQGRTVVLITHATQNVDLCDKIAFLAPGGYLAYYGPPREALDYFGAAKFADIYTTIEQEPRMEVWPQRFQSTPHYARNVAARLAAAGLSAGPGAPGAHAAGLAKAQSPPPASRQVSAFRQFRILSQRYLETLTRDRRNLLTLLLQAPVIAIMVALVFNGPIFDTTPIKLGGAGNHSDARKLTFLLAMVAVWFGTSNSAREIVKEAAIYARERRINLKLAPYIASKFVVLTALAFVQTFILLLPFLVTGVGFWRLPILHLSLLTGAIAGIGMGLLISAQASNPDRASSLVPLVLIPQVIFAGGLVGIPDLLIEGGLRVNGNPLVLLISHLMVTKWTWRAIGATVALDDVPPERLEIQGVPPSVTPGSVANNPFFMHDNGKYYYLADVGENFRFNPLFYLLILGGFIALSLILVTVFQKRKDRVR